MSTAPFEHRASALDFGGAAHSPHAEAARPGRTARLSAGLILLHEKDSGAVLVSSSHRPSAKAGLPVDCSVILTLFHMVERI
jgi:hypothetical protein